MDKSLINNQALFEHALCFDPINQARVPGGNERLHFNAFEHIPGAQTLEDGSIEVTFFAPGAKTVQLKGIGGSMAGTYDFWPMDLEGYWKTIIKDVGPGFHYHKYLVDGVPTMHPQVPFGYGCSYVLNFFEVPDPEQDFYLLKEVPHGTVHQEIYYSKVTNRYRNCLIYTPPSYGNNTTKKYPVFYLQHGGGENETGWLWQGKINYIMDNLISEGKCEEMIVVMNSGYNFRQSEDGTFILGDLGDVICKDCIPMIDSKYRTVAQKEYRAMAGLSFGSVHARTTVLSNLDVFSNLGIFSGGFDFKSQGALGVDRLGDYDYSSVFTDADTFNSQLKLLFVGMGEQETGMIENAKPKVEDLISKGYHMKLFTCPGYHEWDVWRKCAYEMSQLLFR